MEWIHCRLLHAARALLPAPAAYVPHLLLLMADGTTFQPASRSSLRWRVARHWLAVLVLVIGGWACRAQSPFCETGEVWAGWCMRARGCCSVGHSLLTPVLDR